MFTPLNTGHAKNVRNLTVDNYTNWYIFNFHSCKSWPYISLHRRSWWEKNWYNPDPLLLWGNGILRTLALASGSTSFLRLNADHHIQQGIDFLLHQSLSKLILCNGFYYTIWWYYKLISLYRTPLINTLSTALPGPILAETRSGL